MTGLAAVVGADPEQPAQHVGDVAAEDAAVRVQLVDDDDLELLEQLEPLRVVGQDRRVEHVRVRDHDLAGGPDRRADRRGRVAVVGRGRGSTGRPPRTGSPNSATWSWPSALVGKRNSARAAGSSAIACRTGTRVAQRLARRRRRDDDDVLAARGPPRSPPPGGVYGRSMPRDASPATIRGSSHAGNVAVLGRPRGDDRVVDDAARDRRLRQQAREDGRRVGGGVGAHRTASE